jgi:hypothetical protein
VVTGFSGRERRNSRRDVAWAGRAFAFPADARDTRAMGMRVAVACVLLGACTVHGSGKSATPAFKTYNKQHPLVPDAPQFMLAPLTIEVTNAVLLEHYNVVSNDGWTVALDLLVTNQDAQSQPVRPDIGIEGAEAECQVGSLIDENGNDAAWERLPQSTLLRAGASARMKVLVGCNHADKLGGAFNISFDSTKLLLRRQ